MRKEKEVEVGTIRIGKDLQIYEKIKTSWKLSKKKLERDFPEALVVINLFKANKIFNELIDKKDPKFLKGQLSSEGTCQGARINILPDGKKIDGAYSLFAKHLTIHDQKSNSHWDVIYQNPNGKFAYHYTLDKKSKAVGKKFNHVKEFERLYPILEKKVINSLEDLEDFMALPMMTLLRTHIRVGNEIYFKLHGHKGLTTLKKKDSKIKKDRVNFKFLGKDGVPQDITKEFPKNYVTRFEKNLKQITKEDFAFKNKQGKLLHENDFKKAFKKYIGIEFYPHIVRSYFATKQTEDFLNKNKRPTKQQVRDFLISVAEELGHKKFSKKNNQWEDSYTVTIGHYIDPKLGERLRKIIKQ